MVSDVSGRRLWIVYQVETTIVEDATNKKATTLHYPCIAQGEDWNEIVNNYLQNVKELYGVELNPSKCGNPKYNILPINMTEINTTTLWTCPKLI